MTKEQIVKEINHLHNFLETEKYLTKSKEKFCKSEIQKLRAKLRKLEKQDGISK